MVQASIVIITTAAGRLQDLSHSSLDPGVTLWLVYAFTSVIISGALLFLSCASVGHKWLPAARLAQVAPRRLEYEVERLWDTLKLEKETTTTAGAGLTLKQKESVLKSPRPENRPYVKWLFVAGAVVVILAGWIMFGLGIEWGVHGNVIAGTVGE